MRIGVTIPIFKSGPTRELLSWSAIRDLAQHAEGIGVDSLWLFDHLYAKADPPEPMYEAWTMQSALAAVTSRVELGQLVTCVSFRSPGLLAKMAVTADEISGGRITLGIGAGWYDREYTDFGFPTDHRGSRFAEALTIISGLLRGDEVTMKGRFYQVDGAILLPAPTRRIPLLIAGQGPRMLGLVARDADAWNTAWHKAPDERLHQRLGNLRAALDEAGRAHSSMRVTVGMVVDQWDPESLAAAIAAFDGLGIDDLILEPERPGIPFLDMLAKVIHAN